MESRAGPAKRTRLAVRLSAVSGGFATRNPPYVGCGDVRV